MCEGVCVCDEVMTSKDYTSIPLSCLPLSISGLTMTVLMVEVTISCHSCHQLPSSLAETQPNGQVGEQNALATGTKRGKGKNAPAECINGMNELV